MNCEGPGLGEAQNELDGSLATSARNLSFFHARFMRGSCAGGAIRLVTIWPSSHEVVGPYCREWGLLST